MSYYKQGMSLPVQGHRCRTVNYHVGSASLPGEVVGFRLVNSPGYLLDEIERLDGEITTTDADLQTYLFAHGCAFLTGGTAWNDPLSAAAVERDKSDHEAIAKNPPQCLMLEGYYDGPWLNFVTKWKEFKDGHDSHGALGWYERFWGSLMETIDSYRESLRVMRDGARSAGFVLNSPAPVDPRKGALDAAGDAVNGLAGMLKVAFYAALIGGGILLLFWGFGALRHGGSLAGKYMVVG